MVIESILKKVNTFLTTHQWNGNETDIATLRFFINTDSGNFLHKNFKEHVCTQISQYNKIDKKKIPPFKCNYSSPFAIDEDGNRTSTTVYDFQCRHQDATTLIKQLQTAYIDFPIFVFPKRCYQNFQVYCITI